MSAHLPWIVIGLTRRSRLHGERLRDAWPWAFVNYKSPARAL